MTALAAEHVADLQHSGLSESTIAALHFEAVRPHNLKIQGVTSAYRLPYFELSGRKNCFERWKLFPARTLPDGSTQKYFQDAGTAPQLYLPPLCSWTRIAKTIGCEILLVEGEKKSAAACERGKFAIGVGGVWNWRQRLDTGERLVIPTLDQFIWKGRTVELVPDSDAWRDQKLLDVLSGFFALGQELISRGATVRLLKLPERAGIKTGLDDFLVASGDEWELLWAVLERVALDDDRLSPVAAWWQRWRENQATEAAIRQHDADELEVAETAGLYTLSSPKHAVLMTFDRLSEQRNGVSAELTITLGRTELLSGVDLGLKSDAGQTKISQSLKGTASAIPWKFLLQRACSLVLRQYRRGEPVQQLTKHTTVEPLSYTLNPLVFRRKTTILFGDGGLGKSSLGLLCAMTVSTGSSVAGFSALSGRALYLDYEDDADVHTRRLHAIIQGHPDLAAAEVSYLRCTEPLTRLVHALVRRIQEDRITFLVLDSLIASTGGDPSAEATAKLFAALRLLNTDVLALGHIPKTQAEGQDRVTVYGSVFNQNFARSIWEFKKEQAIGDDVSVIGLFNRKSNLSRLHYPIGLKVTQNEESTRIYYEPYDLSQAAELATALPIPNRIRNLLETDGIPRSSKEIADELNVPLPSVKAVLSKHRGVKWHIVGEGREAKWTALNR